MKESFNGPVQANRSDGIKPGIGIERKINLQLTDISPSAIKTIISHLFIAKNQRAVPWGRFIEDGPDYLSGSRFEWYIDDRWGEQVFKTDEIGIYGGWDDSL